MKKTLSPKWQKRVKSDLMDNMYQLIFHLFYGYNISPGLQVGFMDEEK